MNIMRAKLIFIILLLVISIVFAYSSFSNINSSNANGVPNFSSITDVKTKKEMFFSYMQPKIKEENDIIRKQREKLKSIIDNMASGLSNKDKSYIEDLSLKYKVQTAKEIDLTNLLTLYNRVDIIPASLGLAQSSKESGWGTSRFATQGNNYFGQWCYEKGCGIVPKRRYKNAKHEVAVFKDTKASVKAYIRNINSGAVYEKLRNIRAKLRSSNKPVLGYGLAPGLTKYSERGEKYVKEIQAMIRSNKLERYDVVAKL